MKKLVLLLLVSCVVMGAYIKPKTLKWTASTESDLAGYRVYLVPNVETMSYESPYVEIAKDILSYSLPGSFTIVDGQHKLGLAAYDYNGNISNIKELPCYLDFTAPSEVLNVELLDI